MTNGRRRKRRTYWWNSLRRRFASLACHRHYGQFLLLYTEQAPTCLGDVFVYRRLTISHSANNIETFVHPNKQQLPSSLTEPSSFIDVSSILLRLLSSTKRLIDCRETTARTESVGPFVAKKRREDSWTSWERSKMSSSISLHIPAGKLGTVRIDRTVDVYSTSKIYGDTTWNATSYIPSVALPHTLSTPSDVELSSSPPTDVGTTKSNDLSDEDVSDIAVIYSVVRRASTRRASSPRISVLPLLTNPEVTSACAVKTYTLEPPQAPLVVHRSPPVPVTTQTLPSFSNPQSLTPPIRIQTSSSFTSHDRPSVPLIAIKPRPYSFRSPRRSVIERQISHITERVTQLHDSFFSRLSSTPQRQRNRSHSTFNATFLSTSSNEPNAHSIKPRPKSATFEDHYRVNSGRVLSSDHPSMPSSREV